MKKMSFAISIAAAFIFVPQVSRAQGISFGVFYSSLSPYGEWVNAGAYGMCWHPVSVPYGWRPYTYGHWVWTEYGWTWVSADPWGWAVFHYGRWMFDPMYGWVWVPGYVWAPAWVQWRWGGGYCGWAPMPPGFHFRVDVIITGRDDDFGVGAGGWNFVRAREIGAARYAFIGQKEVPRIMGTTRNVTRFRFTAAGVYNVGIQRQEVERVTRTRIETVNIVRGHDPARERMVGNQFHIYAPTSFRPQVKNEEPVIVRERAVERERQFHPTPPPQQRARENQVQPGSRQESQRPSVAPPAGRAPIAQPREQPKGRERAAPKPSEKPKKDNSRQRDHGPGRSR